MSADHDTGQSDNITPFWMIGGAGVEVEVDTETGHVRIVKLVNVIDCGTLVNPRIVETQISGASLMQLGFTMFERMHLDAGQVTNASLADYKIPGFFDVPEMMVNEAIDAYQHNAPFGAKGRRRIRDDVRVAGDRERHRRCGRRATDGIAAQPRSRAACAAKQSRHPAGGRVMAARSNGRRLFR